MGEFKQGEFTIDLKDQRIDNAQYIMLTILNKLNINFLESDSKNTMNQIKQTRLNKILKDRYGISIGTMTNMYGKFEFFLNGIPRIHTPVGNKIVEPNELKEYLLGNLDIQTLHFESKAYIQVINHNHPENYYGIFYSLNDAIKICSENDLIQIGEVTS